MRRKEKRRSRVRVRGDAGVIKECCVGNKKWSLARSPQIGLACRPFVIGGIVTAAGIFREDLQVHYSIQPPFASTHWPTLSLWNSRDGCDGFLRLGKKNPALNSSQEKHLEVNFNLLQPRRLVQRIISTNVLLEKRKMGNRYLKSRWWILSTDTGVVMLLLKSIALHLWKKEIDKRVILSAPILTHFHNESTDNVLVPPEHSEHDSAKHCGRTHVKAARITLEASCSSEVTVRASGGRFGSKPGMERIGMNMQRMVLMTKSQYFNASMTSNVLTIPLCYIILQFDLAVVFQTCSWLTLIGLETLTWETRGLNAFFRPSAMPQLSVKRS